MKKFTTIAVVLILIAFGAAACGKKGGTGSATAEDMLTMLPKSTQGIVVIDVKAAMSTEFVDKAIKDSKDNQKYLEFVKETGVDPQKDINFAVIGLTGEVGATSQSGVGIINLKYTKDALLAKLKEKATNVQEEAYEGLTLYSVTESEGKTPMIGAFLDNSNIVVGTGNDVKAVIDVVKKKTENALKNTDLAALVKTANKGAMIWSAIAFPPDMMKKVASQNPMLSSLENIKALLLAFDYRNKSLMLEIKGVGGDAEKNKQTAEALNGFKALGAMASAEKPEIGELMNKIEVTSSPEYVRIMATLPDDLLTKLSATAQEQVKGKLAETKPEDEKKGEEKKDEKKDVKK
jgi:hypothetical protein